MGSPATTSTSYTSITNISVPFTFVFFTGSVNFDIVHYIVKVPSEQGRLVLKDRLQSTFICRKEKGLLKCTTIKCLRKCFSLLGNTFRNRLQAIQAQLFRRSCYVNGFSTAAHAQ